MKQLTILLVLFSASMQAQNGMIDLTPATDTDVATAQIRGGGEGCRVDISSDGSIDTSCRTMVNSRGKRIFCTPHKKICKTLDEVQAFLFPPSAASTQPSSSYQSCLDNAPDTHAMRTCNARELAYQDGLLNTHYQSAMHRLSKSERHKLRQAQRAWITYRDTKCEAQGRDMRGGTGEALLIGGCLVEETKKRAGELREIN